MTRRIRVTTSKTIQEFAQKMTGSVANAVTLMSTNKLKTQNLTPGQVLSVPESMMTAQAKAGLTAAAKSSNTKYLMIGALALGAFVYMKKFKTT